MSNTVYIGVDPTAGQRAITYAVLSDTLKVLALGQGNMKEIVTRVLGYQNAICGIDAPSGPNKGLLKDSAYREGVGLPGNRDNYSGYRVGEYELRRRGIYIYNTSDEDDKISAWVRQGWKLYATLREAGYVDYPQVGSRRLFETYPYGIFTVLSGGRPYNKQGLDGLLQRQLILYEKGVDVLDPIHALEELTRHRLMTGQLNLELHTHDELDALAAAYTAYLAGTSPGSVLEIGDRKDGILVLPTTTLKDNYG